MLERQNLCQVLLSGFMSLGDNSGNNNLIQWYLSCRLAEG